MVDDAAVVTPDPDTALPVGQPNAPLTIRPDGRAAPTKESAPAPLPAASPGQVGPIGGDEAPVLDLPWEDSAKKHTAESVAAGPAGALTSGAPTNEEDHPALDLPWKESSSPQSGQVGFPSPQDMSSSDNPPEGSRYAAARANLQKLADQYLVGPPSAGNELETGLTHAVNTYSMNLPMNLAAAINSWRYNTNFSDEYAFLKAEDAALERQNPKSSIAGDVAGIGIGALTLPMIGPEMGASRVASQIAMKAPSLATRAGYGALNSGLYSGAASLIDTKDPYEAAKATALGAGAGFLLTPVAEKLVGAASRLWTGKGSPIDASGNLTAAARQAATDAGIHPDDIEALKPYLVKAFQDKGVSAPAAREAQLAEFKIPPTRGQVTADPGQIYREGQLPPSGPFGDLRAQQQGAIKDARGQLADSSFATPTEGVEKGIENLKYSANVARNKKNKLYDKAYGTPGFFQRDAMFDMGRNVRDHLDKELDVVDELTPMSERALSKIDDLSRMHVPNSVTPPVPNSAIKGIDMRGVDAVRKKLNDLYAHSQGYDRLIMKKIRQQFEKEILDAHNAGMFSGDSDAAIKSMGAARKANADYKSKFFPDDSGDDVGRIISQVIDGRKDANELANVFYNDAQVGGGKSARLYDALTEALKKRKSKNNPTGLESMKPFKEAIKLKLLTPNNPNSQGLIAMITDPQTANTLEIAKRINNFLNNKGSSLAQQVFSPEEIGQLRRYAGALNILGQKGVRPNSDRAHTAMVGMVKAVESLAPLALVGLHGGAHGIIEALALRPILSGLEKQAEARAVKKATQKALSGAPRLQRIAPTFPLVSPHRASPWIDQNDQ